MTAAIKHYEDLFYDLHTGEKGSGREMMHQGLTDK